MATRKSLSQVSKDLQSKFEKAGEFWLDKIPAEMGNHSGVVIVPNKASTVYCRLSSGQVVEVFNNVAPAIYNWKVYIGRDKSQPGLLKVIEVRWVYNVARTVAYVLFHHTQHEYPAPDTVWVMRDQFMPLLVLPAGGFTIRLYGDTIYSSETNTPIKVANSDSIDLSGYEVSLGAKYILVEIAPDGSINYVEGDLVSSLEVLRLPITPLPAPTPGSFPVCAIEFYEGQTEIRRDSTVRNIIDLRMFTSSAIPGAGYQWHTAPELTALNDLDEFGIWEVATGLLKKITWASLMALLDLIYAPLSHTHIAADVSISDAGGYFTSTNVEGALQEIGGSAGGGSTFIVMMPDAIDPPVPVLTPDGDDYVYYS